MASSPKNLKDLISKNPLLGAVFKKELLVQLETMDACEQEGLLRILGKRENLLSVALSKASDRLPLGELKKIMGKMCQTIHDKELEKAERDLNQSLQ